MKRRVVITGMGAVSPIGNDVESLWNGIKNKECGIDKITYFDTKDFRVKLAGEVKNLDSDKYFTKRELKFNDMFTRYARIASKQAIINSGINLDKVNKDKFGVIIASGIGGIDSLENAKQNLDGRGPTKVSPYFIPMTIINMAAGSVAIDVGAKGHCSSMVTACAAASNAIGEAYHKIRDGYEDIMIAGGSEASITPVSIAGFMSMRALYEGDNKKRASIPFDKDRGGFVMGEGSGVLLLETLDSAKERKAKIYAEIVGYGDTCDAYHITAPIDDGSGGAKAMIKAIKDANIKREDIDYINAHGTSTTLNDKIETLAVKTAFGESAYNLKISSTKSNTGHLLGASGAIEAIISIMALENSFIPPTINYKNKDKECDLNIVANEGINEDIKYAMSNSLGFGGHNASLIFKKWEE